MPLSDTALVLEALRARAAQRQKASTRLSAELAKDRAAGKDVRSGAVRVVDELAHANRLNVLADEIAADRLRLTPRQPTFEILTGGDAPQDDGGDPGGQETIRVEGLGLVEILPDHQVDDDDDEIIEV